MVVIGDLLDKAIEKQIDYIRIYTDIKTVWLTPFDIENLLVLSINYRDIEFKDYEFEFDSDMGATWLHIHI